MGDPLGDFFNSRSAGGGGGSIHGGVGGGRTVPPPGGGNSFGVGGGRTVPPPGGGTSFGSSPGVGGYGGKGGGGGSSYGSSSGGGGLQYAAKGDSKGYGGAGGGGSSYGSSSGGGGLQYAAKGDSKGSGGGGGGGGIQYGAKGDSKGYGGGGGGGLQYAPKGDSKGGGGSSYGGGSSSGFGGGGKGEMAEGARFSDLGANLHDIDWTKEKLDPMQRVSGSYQAAAGARTKADVDAWRVQQKISVWGRDVPNPILTFEETGFPQFMLDSFRRQNFKTPSMIQAQGWGPAMAGRDVVGVAKTGSGKTLAFGIPGLLHIAAQPKLQRGDGPLMLVIAPTRELGIQIHDELKKVMPNELRSTICYGGAPKFEQKKELQWGVHVLVATPGRLIDFIESGVTNLRRVTYLVMDEADRMLDMGFEPDVRKIVGQIRPDRQTLLWSATWPKTIQRLASDFTKDSIHVQVGSQELSANDDITQKIVMTHGWQQKQQEIAKQLWDLDKQGIKKVLVFAGTKKGCEELSQVLRQEGFLTGAIHGDKEQRQREQALWNLKSKPRFVLVATDVASRGLDIPKLPAVINYDFPEQMEDYVHRIGRTGRAGNKGLAITFFTAAKDCGHASKLIQLLKKANQEVPHALQQCTSMTPPDKPQYGGKKKFGGGGGGGGWGGGGKGGGGKGGGGGGWGRSSPY